MKFKESLRKLGEGLLAVGMVFSVIPKASIPVNAQDVPVYSIGEEVTNYTINMGGITQRPSGLLMCNKHNHEGEGEVFIQNVRNCPETHRVFCIDIKHGMPFNGKHYNLVKGDIKQRTVDFLAKDYFGGNKTKAEEAYKKVGYAQAAGYGFGGDTSQSMVQATQMVIWEYGNNVKYQGGAPEAVEVKYEAIKKRVEDATKHPDFRGNADYKHLEKDLGEITLHGYGKDNALTLTDKNEVLKWFEQDNVSTNNGKLHLEVNGNTCKVWADEGYKDGGKIVVMSRYLTENESVEESGFLYEGNNVTQTLCVGGLDPTRFRLNVKMQTGEVSVEKQDSETGTKTQGEATFKGAKFDLYDKATNKKVPNQTTITVNANGKGDHIWKNLDTTKQYIVKETGAPAGYLLNSKGVNVQFEEKDGKKISHSIIKDTVIKGKVSIHKTYLPDNKSGIPVNEEGAEFEVRQNYGAKEVVATLVTDKDGNAISGDLPYGKYTLKQTKAGGEYGVDQHVYDFTISKDKEVIPYGVIVNTENEYGIQIVKKDETTGEYISYTGAKFQFYKDGEDKPISAKVGKKQYDTFVTRNSSTDKGAKNEFYASDEDEMGTVETPLVLKAGKYKMVEIEAPKGYEKQTYDIEVGQGAMTRVDEDGNPIVVIEATDKPYMDTLEFEKQLLTYSKIEYDPTEIEFTLFAKTDYISMVNGKVLAKAGSPVQTVRGLIEDNKIVFRFNPVYAGEFILKETAVPDGIAIDKTEHPYSVSEKGTFYDGKAKVDPIIIVNEESTTTFSKVDAGGEEVVGAKMKLTDENGEVIDEWTSEKVAHVVYGLVEGKKYTLHEDLAPVGMNLAQDITFTAGVKNHVKMVDTVTTIAKTENGSDKHVKGAVLEVRDKKGKVYDKWTSNGKVHEVKGLTIGETYIVRELKAPKGYVKGEDKEFTVVKDKDTVIQYENRREIITGVSTGITPIAFAVIAVITLLGIGGYSYYKKKK